MIENNPINFATEILKLLLFNDNFNMLSIKEHKHEQPKYSKRWTY